VIFLEMGIVFYLAIVLSGLATAFAINKVLRAVKLI